MSDEINQVNSIEIFSADDKKIKIFAEIISNKSSNKILHLLFKNEMTANEIAQETKTSLQLVKYHLEKMQKIELVCISRIGKNSKSRDMNYYKASKFAIVITHSDVIDKAKQSKLLVRSFQSIYRFFGMCILSIMSIFSIMLMSSEQSILKIDKLPFILETSQEKVRIGVPNSIDESIYLAEKKVDAVISNPGGGSGTPYFDPYSVTLPFEVGELIITMLMIAGIGIILSLPFFLRSHRYEKQIMKTKQAI